MKKVICIRSYKDQFTFGKVYMVKIIKSASNNFLRILEDDLGSTTNTWNADNFIPDTKLARLFFCNQD